MQAQQDTYCIVGAGQGGCELALALRQQGCTGSIVVFGDESHLPYQRPPLSKACLKGDLQETSLRLRQPAAYERAGVELVLDTRVARIDRQSKTIVLGDGVERPYAKLGLATGGRPRRLAIPEGQRAERAGNFRYLRTIDDVRSIREHFAPGRRLVIVGGGYIGLEVAASAVARNLNVTVLEALPRVLARVMAPEVSSFYERVHREAGVDLRTGIEVRGFEFGPGDAVITAVRCSDGSSIAADLVITGIGLVPNTELAQEAGLAVDNGIIVDEYARTGDPDIVAAGDCANFPDAITGRRVRLESVPNAVEQARTAAASLLGGQRPHAAVPWFWSDQYDLKLQIAGLSSGYDQVVLRGSTGGRSFAAFYLQQQRLIACDAVNRPQEFMMAKRLLTSHRLVDAALLADESVPLKSIEPLPT